MTQKHFNTKRALVLDNIDRLAELQIDKLLSDLVDIKEGMTCVDLGCGTGVFSFVLTKYVGDNGIVYAVDDSNEMLGYIRKRKPPQTIILIHRDAGDTGLKSEIVDFCLVAFLLHEIDKPERIINEAYRILKPHGKILVVEWKKKPTPKGPPIKVRIAEDKLKLLFIRSGFIDSRSVDWSVNHYVAVGIR